MDVTWLRFDTVRSALALAAFGVTGCLAWLQGDVNIVSMATDEGVTVEAVVDSGAPADPYACAGFRDAGEPTTRSRRRVSRSP